MLAYPALSQDSTASPSAWQHKILPPGTDSLFIDSMLVYGPGLVFTSMRGDSLSPDYEFWYQGGSYLWLKEPLADSLLVYYQRLPIPVDSVYRNKDTSLILPKLLPRTEPVYTAEKSSEVFEPFRGLNSAGSISRGVSVGNSQDAVLNSNLNLQLSGNIGNNTTLSASITDNNIPVQADGYTQQLREFDRVYLELENPDFGILRAGDYNMTGTGHYLLNFDKRISGAGVFTDITPGDKLIPLQLQGGLARGRFARNRFQADEGNQGPYKLKGSRGEQFIIIISGSERVYVDGILMKRGQQYDYVIDYNAGEITFTTLQPMTKERRVVVEFQYTEQNYLRSVVFGNAGFVSDNISTSVQLYSEQDSKNQPLLNDLSDDDKRVLSRVGDDLDEAEVSTITPVPFSDDEVLYELRDSLGVDSVLVFSTDSTTRLYRASFLFVGKNRGNYRQARNDANGRVFEWVPPVGGVPQGSYAPVRRLPAPNQLQILSTQLKAKLGDQNELIADIAVSRYDQNLFSDQGEQDDAGLAGRLQYITTKELKEGEWINSLNYEFNQQNFQTVERIRRVEFARDWNLPLNYNGEVQMAGWNSRLVKPRWGLSFGVEGLGIEGYRGLRNEISARIRDSLNLGAARLSWLITDDSTSRSDFVRESLLYQRFLTPKFWVGTGSLGEWNLRETTAGDSLRGPAYQFVEYSFFTGFGDSTASFAEVKFLERYDDTTVGDRMLRFSRARVYGFRSVWKTSFNSNLTTRINQRNLKIFRPVEQDLEQTTTLRVNYLQKLLGNSIVSSTFYETGSGTEPRRSFSYVEVAPGTGSYIHTDYNNNGIKELGEFEPAPLQALANYVRVFTPTNEYLRTALQSFGENLNINAPADWIGRDDWKSAVARFSVLTNYQVSRKTLLEGQQNRINPFAEVADDSLIVALSNNFRNTLFFNRTATDFGINYTYLNSDNRNLLSFGVEQRAVEEHQLAARYQVVEPLLAKAELARADKANRSANFLSRNFSIDQQRVQFSLSYQAGTKLLITGRYEVDDQESQGETPNLLLSQVAGLEMAYNNAAKISARMMINYVKNDFEGRANSPAGFEMLKGLQPGNNGTWELVLQRSLKKNILISLNYAGRVSNDVRPIHTGNLEVKAFF